MNTGRYCSSAFVMPAPETPITSNTGGSQQQLDAMIADSTVPIFAPIAVAMGIDPLAFAIIGIVAIETGLLTPPFGLLVFTVKAAIQDPAIGVGKIFAGAMPYWALLLAVIACLWYFPAIATYLPGLLKVKT